MYFNLKSVKRTPLANLILKLNQSKMSLTWINVLLGNLIEIPSFFEIRI